MCTILCTNHKINYKIKMVNKKDYILSVINFTNVKRTQKGMLYYVGSILRIIDFQQETRISTQRVFIGIILNILSTYRELVICILTYSSTRDDKKTARRSRRSEDRRCIIRDSLNQYRIVIRIALLQPKQMRRSD